MTSYAYYTVGSHGAVRYVPAKQVTSSPQEEDKKLRVEYSRRREYVDYKKLPWEERFLHKLREVSYFDFIQSKWDRQLKAKFSPKKYNEILREKFLIVRKEMLKGVQRCKKAAQKLSWKELNNRYDVLPQDPDYSIYYAPESDTTIEYNDKQYHFIQKDYVKIKHDKNVRSREFKKLINMCKSMFVRKTKHRNMLLLTRLRQKIADLQMQRMKKNMRYHVEERRLTYLDEYQKFVSSLEGQMSDTQQGAQGVNVCPEVSTQSNTLDKVQRDTSVGVPAVKVPRQKKRFNKLASAESSPDYSNLTSRYFPHKTYNWSAADEKGKKLVELTLPLDFVVNHPNSANCTLFNNYTYWDGDMSIKLMINSNKFQQGQLQAAWYYAQDYEKNFERRDNVYSASQQAHCLASASASNEGILEIPFRYYKPKMGTKLRKDDPGRLNMGRLTVRVLNQLTNPDKVFNTCTFTISFSFENSNFSGMIARDFGNVTYEQQMMKVVRTAMNLLEELDMDPNRDNPPDVRPPNVIVPWSAHSWSVGDNLTEPTNPLRLSGIGQTPHPAEVTPQVDEMTVDRIASVFGLVKTVSWDASMRTGTLLFMIDGAPMWELTNYHREVFDGSNCYALPPVTVLSQLFAQWRGTLLLRLDFISTLFHSGRILIGYVPRVLEVPTIEQIKSCPHEIFDLQGEVRQDAFKIPYIADRPWWPTGGFGKRVIAPSHVYCFVLNELVPMQSVSNKIDINLYFAADRDFELSVPVAPRIGLSTYNAYVKPATSAKMSTKDGYTPMFAGNWRYVDDSKVYVMRYGNVTDHVVQFNNLLRHKVYEPDTVANGGVIIRGRQNATEWYLVATPVDATKDNGLYCVYIPTLANAKLYAKTEDPKYALAYTSDTGYFDNATTHEPVTGIIYFKEVVEFEGQMGDERKTISTCNEGMLPLVSGTRSGLFTFGEDFSNLKTLLRRYQLYYSYRGEFDLKDKYNQCICLPILPQGLPKTNKYLDDYPVYNIQREGIIPIIASAFRFYRGGVRFRLVWRSNWDCSIRLENRPDERLETLDLSVKGGHRSTYNDGYAYIIQNTNTNRIIELEIPFYQCGLFGFLQNPNINDDLESYHYTLGNLYTSFACDTGKKNVNFDYYYSLADDCRFSVFQGFPMMMFAPDEVVTKISSVSYSDEEYSDLEGQMGIKDMYDDLKKTLKNTSKISENLLEIVEPQPQPSTSKIDPDTPVPTVSEEKKNAVLDWIKNAVPDSIQGNLINMFSNLIHCVISPTIKTIAWSLAMVLVSIGIISVELVQVFSSCCKKLVQYIFDRPRRGAQTKQSPELLNLEGQIGEMPEDISAGVVSTVVAGICAGMGVVAKTPKTFPDFMSGIWNNCGKFAMTANHLCTFFKNNLTWILKCYHWCVSKVFPNKALAMELQDCEDLLKDFSKEAVILLDEANARKIEYSPKWNLRVYSCAATASILLLKMSQSKNAPYTPALLTLCKDILKKRDDLVRMQLSPPVRFEPFVLQFSGDPNIGKSHICQNVGKELLKSIDYKTYEELIYTRTPGNPYWNSLRNQPICLFDDFCAINGEYGMQQAAELFCLKSRAVFNPPQPDLSDKKIRYNPLLVLLAANQNFPKVTSVECHEAFYRRRDMLVSAEKDKSYYIKKGVDPQHGSPNQFNRNDISEYQHLRFRIAENSAKTDTPWSDSMSYAQLCDVIKSKFSQFYEKELEQYKSALKEAFDFYPDEDDFISTKDQLDEMANNINNVNKYRYGNVEELKVFVMSSVSLIKSDSDEALPILLSAMRTLAVFNSKIVSEICDKYPIVGQAYSLKTIINTLEGNVGEGEKKKRIINCPHTLFRSSLDFLREDPIDETFNRYIPTGYFFDVRDPNAEKISEENCVGECFWNDEQLKLKVLRDWLEDKYSCERREWYKQRDYQKLPHVFIVEIIKQRLQQKVSINLAGAVRDDTKKWYTWAAKTAKMIGTGLWLILKWALKLVLVLGGIIGFTGWVYNKVYPEEIDVRKAEKMIENGAIYKSANQATLGALDATYIVNAELMNGKHFSQAIYPSMKEQDPQMSASGDYKTFGKTQPNNVKDLAMKYLMSPQMSSEKEHAVRRLIARNTVFIVAEYGGTKFVYGRLLGLVDHYALSVDHYHDRFKSLVGQAKFYIRGHGYDLPIDYDTLSYSRFTDSSLGVYKLPKQIPPFKNIVKHIARRRDHNSVGPCSTLVETSIVMEEKLPTIIVHNLYCDKIQNLQIPASDNCEAFIVPDGYKYNVGARGMCGSVLVSDHLEHPIYGVHVAGDKYGKCGISEAIYFEMFDSLVKKTEIQDIQEPVGQLFEGEGFLQPQSHVLVLGQVISQMAHRETGVSKVIPTECHGEIFPVYCAPPVLGKNDERIKDDPFSPMQEGVNKHGLVTHNFPSELVELAYEDLNNLLLAKVRPIRGKVGKLSKAIAVVGDKYVEGFDKLDFNTSEGFPYVPMRPKGTKSKLWMLDLEQDEQQRYTYKGCNDFLKEVMKVKKNQRLNRVLPFTVFTDCLKDRKLPLEKATQRGKVRIFSISPLDYTIQCRQYFMDFTVSYQNARLDVEHAVGINVNSIEWSDLALRLLNKGNNIVTADYSGFGPSLNAICAKKAFDIMRNWYRYNGDHEPDNDLSREMLGYEAIYSVHLVFNTVYRTLCGLPSGGPLTVICNTLVNCLYVRIAWMLNFSENLNFVSLSESNVNRTLASFHKHCVMFTYGDDLIISVSDEASEVFNCVTLANVLNKYSIVVKNATKNDEIIKYSSLTYENTTFLKNRFVMHPFRHLCWLAALDKSSVEDTLNWTFKEWLHKLREISIEASDAAIRNAYGHGPEYYEEVRSKVFDYWRKKQEFMTTPSWHELDIQNFG